MAAGLWLSAKITFRMLRSKSVISVLIVTTHTGGQLESFKHVGVDLRHFFETVFSELDTTQGAKQH